MNEFLSQGFRIEPLYWSPKRGRNSASPPMVYTQSFCWLSWGLGSSRRSGHIFKAINTLQSAASLACDLIATYLCLLLKAQKGEMMKTVLMWSGGRTNTVIDMLIRDAINRRCSSAVNMILFLALPNTFWCFLGLAPSNRNTSASGSGTTSALSSTTGTLSQGCSGWQRSTRSPWWGPISADMIFLAAADTTDILCSRWAMVGAFYPSCVTTTQTPRSARSFTGGLLPLRLRRMYWIFGPPLMAYSSIPNRLLDYFYTAFHDASLQGTPAPLVSPLWFKYPKDTFVDWALRLSSPHLDWSTFKSLFVFCEQRRLRFRTREAQDQSDAHIPENAAHWRQTTIYDTLSSTRYLRSQPPTQLADFVAAVTATPTPLGSPSIDV
ncbi:hypothetical protein B0H14DRAFT_2579385 [Mycena olivaceomarginata]|nr:hypothetical protein B0H14DRAFT_2579385 [Mycena olivaceomarginata]